jgi:pimeloyl-ACP methyl ester carboxylesterase
MKPKRFLINVDQTVLDDLERRHRLFAKDSTHAPREWAQRFFNVQRYTELPRGGHFAAFEEPQLLAEDLRAFFRPLHAS